MAIPESQLETWSHQGSITQSSNTYSSIKNVLKTQDSPYTSKNYKVFLQGSYGNDTNIYSESDVDIVIKLNDCFLHDLSELRQEQQEAFKAAHSNAGYKYANFKRDVFNVLTNMYGNDVTVGEKAIVIAANRNRRKADVITAIQYRRYRKFISKSNQSYDKGICFYSKAGELIANYPKQHSENLTKKHQSTSTWFKPVARILKNMRRKMVDEGILDNGVAPSYYLEGLLYNVPNDKFGKSYEKTIINSINWILDADRDKFVCANEQYQLLYNGSPVTWQEEKCDAFLTALLDFWSQW